MKSILRFICMVLVTNLIMYTAGISPAAAITGPSLTYSTYLGGTVEDRVNAIALDSSGNVYLTGLTVSGTVANTFPGTSNSSLQNFNKGGTDIFVAKISAAGTLMWTTLLGGSGTDIATAIAVDGSGIVYITGSTTSTDFPTASPYQANTAGGTDAFVTAIKADGTGLIYSTYIGSPGLDEGNGIAVDSAGNAYVTGLASANFPKTPGTYTAVGGMTDAFVAKFSAAGALSYSTILGGTGLDVGRAIVIDGIGNAYVTGQAADAFFPTASFANTFKTTITGSFDVFVAKLDPTGANLLYATYVGGSDIDDAFGIALDGTNPATLNVYITGYTFSADMPKPGSAFATTGQTTIGTAPDAYVFKLNMNGGGGDLDGVYFTYLGGSTDDRATAIKVDGTGNAYVTGHTTSGDFPMVQPINGTLVGGGMVFVTEIGPTGGTKIFSTYLGGVTDQQGNGIGLDSSGNIYVAGWTSSGDYPTAGSAPMPLYPANAGSYDGFLTKISAPSPAAAPLPAITGVNPPGGIPAGGTIVVITGSGFTGATSIKFGGVNATSYTTDSDNQITAIAPAHSAGIVNIVATNAVGSSSIVPADNYTYFVAAPATPAPSITSLNPSLGTSAGGTTVVIIGSGFTGITGANGVKFGDLIAASYTVDSNTQITAIAPAHTAGMVDVVATSLNGSSALTTADKYTYFIQPVGGGYFDPYIFPSPTTGSTAGIAYFMASAGTVNIRVYNEIGNLMYAQDERKPAGSQGSNIDVGRLAPGVYFYLLNVTYDNRGTDKYGKRKFAVMH
jgi:hypothetical protein